MRANLFNIQKFSLHDGPGIRTVVFFQGCNLRCQWCANPESQPMSPPTLSGKPAGRAYTLDEVLDEALKDAPFYAQSGGGVTLSGGEPLLQLDFALALADALHAEGVTVGLESACCVDAWAWARAYDHVDFVLADVKHWDDRLHRRFTGVPVRAIHENIRYAIAGGKPTTLRVPVVPGVNDSPDDARAFARLFAGWGAREAHLLPFHQLGAGKYRELGMAYPFEGVAQLHPEDLSSYAEILRGAGLDVQIGG